MSYTEPLLLLFLAIGAAGLYRLRGRLKKGDLALPVLALAGLFCVSWMPVAWLLAQPLEMWYPRRALPAGDAQAIVVLSGGSLIPRPEAPYALAERDTYERCLRAAWLHKHWRPLPVLASGGPAGAGEPLAATMRRVLEGEGVPPELVWTEERSRSTYENAAYSAKVLRGHGISRVVLVTEASHMFRAELSFRRQGLTVEPAPCGFTHLRSVSGTLVPGWRAIYRNERTLHETLALLWYWVRGRA